METIDTVVDATPHREFVHDARHQGQSLDARVVGVHPNYATANRLNVAQGRFIQTSDLKHFSNICVIGSELAETLFRHQSPIGRSVQIANQHFFRVVGITRYRTPSAGVGSSLSAEDFNRDIYIPLTSDRARIGETLERFQQGSYVEEKLELSQVTAGRKCRPSQTDSRGSTRLAGENSQAKGLCHRHSPRSAGASQGNSANF